MSSKYKAVVGPLLIGASLLTGNAVLITIAGGIGVNWTSDGLATLWEQVGHTLSRSTQLDKVYEEAISRGVRRLRTTYERQTGRKSPATFTLIESCAKYVAQTELSVVPVQLEKVQQQLANSLAKLIYGHDPDAAKFIETHLLGAVAQEFRIGLANDEKAWRLFYGWLIEVTSHISNGASYQQEQTNAVLTKLLDSATTLQVLLDLSEQNKKGSERIEAALFRVETTTHQIDGKLNAISAQAGGESLRNQVLSFTKLIEAKTLGFIGRDFVFASIDDFVRTNPTGYFVIYGEPGVGKTSILAKLIERQPRYIHHFNVAPQNLRSPKQFLSNVCARIILTYGLEPRQLPQHATENSNFLVQLLQQAANNHPGDPIVVVVDALDESDHVTLPASVNALYLPEVLPQRVYFVVSSRPVSDARLSVEHSKALYLDARSPENERDIKHYITRFTGRPTMQEKLRQWGVTADSFTEELWSKSEGNFMYLHYILPAIEEDRLAGARLDELPDGLVGYYKRHWRQMREAFGRQFGEIYTPIVCVLAVAREPITSAQIAAWTSLPKSLVDEAIEQWTEFLDFEKNQKHSGRRYRIYHSSFQDFLKSQVDLGSYEDLLANYYLTLWGIEP